MKTIDQFLAELRHLDIQIWAEGDRLCYQAPKGVLSPILREKLQEHKKEIIAFLQKKNCAINSNNVSILSVSRDIDIPLSLNQERIWNLQQLYPDSSVYNLSVALHLVGSLNLKILEQSVETIVKRHEILRTIFQFVDGKPISVISSNSNIMIPVLDLQKLTNTEREAKVKHLVNKEAQLSFHLVENPLWRLTLLRLATEEHILQLTMHHIISDGASFSLFFQELGLLYKAYCNEQISHLPELPIQYADFAHWQHQSLQSEMLESQIAYWKQQMSGSVPVIKLPINPIKPIVRSYQGDYQSVVISQDLTNSLKLFSKTERFTLFTILLTVFNILLYQYTQQEDIILCSPFSGRTRSETQKLIGYFNNLLPIRINLSDNPSFLELLGRVHRLVSEANEHQDIPFQRIMDFPNLLRSPISKVAFGFQSLSQELIELPEINITVIPVHNGTANFDFGLFVDDRIQILTAKLEYRTALFNAQNISEVLENFQTLLKRLITYPEQHLSSLPSLKLTQTNQLLEKLYEFLPAFTTSDQTRLGPEGNFVAPRDELELQLTKIWEKVLGIQPIGIKDNFFDLGGHSLLAVRLVAEIDKAFDKKLPLATFFQAPTVEQLTKVFHNQEWKSSWYSLVPVQPSGSRPPLFGISHNFRDLSHYLGQEQPVYRLHYAIGETTDKEISLPTLENLAAHYIQEMRSLQPEGPYYLMGLSFGGVVAYEMAQQLVGQGQQVAFLGLFDTFIERQRTFLPLYQRFSKLFQLTPFELLRRIKNKIEKKFVKDDNKYSPYVYKPNLYGRMREAYTPQVYSGRVTLFKAMKEVSVIYAFTPPEVGWRKLVNGELEIHEIPGTHVGILEELNVKILAEKMRACIEKSLNNE